MVVPAYVKLEQAAKGFFKGFFFLIKEKQSTQPSRKKVQPKTSETRSMLTWY